MKNFLQSKSSRNVAIGLFIVSITAFLAHSAAERSNSADDLSAIQPCRQAVVLTPDQAVLLGLLQGNAARELVKGPLSVEIKSVSGEVVEEYEIDLAPTGPVFLRVSGD
jgi:hypothetical protein